MATYQLRYGGNICESPVDATQTFTEGTPMTLNTSSAKYEPAPSDAEYSRGVRFIYTGYPSTRPDIQEVNSAKSVFGPAIIETDVVSGIGTTDIVVGTLVAAKSGMLVATADPTDIQLALGQVTEKRTNTVVIQIFE